MGVTAKAVMESLGRGEEASAFAKVQAYAQQVGEMESCAQAAGAVGVFTKASFSSSFFLPRYTCDAHTYVPYHATAVLSSALVLLSYTRAYGTAGTAMNC